MLHSGSFNLRRSLKIAHSPVFRFLSPLLPHSTSFDCFFDSPLRLSIDAKFLRDHSPSGCCWRVELISHVLILFETRDVLGFEWNRINSITCREIGYLKIPFTWTSSLSSKPNPSVIFHDWEVQPQSLFNRILIRIWQYHRDIVFA